MPTPDTADALPGTATDAVRALLGVLGAPALGQALALEKALTGRLQDLDRAPDAAGFDPLARPTAGTAPARSRTPTADATARRRPAPAEPAAPVTRGIGALIGDALAGKGGANPLAAGTLAGIAAALAGLSGPAPGMAQAHAPQPTPGPTSARQATRAVALGTTGAVSQAAGLGAQALAALPGTAGVAPVLEQIAALGNALWRQIALTPPPAPTATPAQPPAKRPARRGPAGTGTQTDSPAARSRAATPATGAGTGAGPDGSIADSAHSALAGIGRLTVELFEYAARVDAASQIGDPTPAAPRQHPAPRAPSVLAPERGASPAGAGSAPAVAPAASGPSAAATGFAPSTAPTTADDLARALRAEGALRGVDLP